MNELISPKYQMELVSNIEKAIWEEYQSYNQVRNYIIKWYDGDINWENFRIFEKKDGNFDLNRTLHSMPGEYILKIAIDLGIETPDFIPSVPTFKNMIKANYKTAYDTFSKAFKQIETDPNIAIGLSNSALESIIKEILKDERINYKLKGTETLYKLAQLILKEFNILNNEHPIEIKTIGSSLLAICQSIEKLRSNKTFFHGKTENDYLINDSVYTYFIVNAISTIGLYLNSYYLKNFPKQVDEFKDVPF